MEILAVLTSLWASLAAVLSSVDWLSLAGYLAATGAIGLVGIVWRSRSALAARWPWIGASFELLEVVGFSPTAFGEWVRRRSWYRRGQVETGKLPRIFPGSIVVLVLCFACSSAQLPEGLTCPTRDTLTLPAAISIARALLPLVVSSCGPSCPPELADISDTLNGEGATAKDVCQAVSVARRVPCELCSDRLAAVDKLITCPASP
jgi:hypothetical protein